ncbi:MAG: hypothetical protein OEL66_00115 [Desulfobulbaceae bacterium]|nr:hypothetical protein [Desulfobulbaceae bacterium]
MNTCKIFPILLLTTLLASAGCSGVQQPTPTADNNGKTAVTTDTSHQSGEVKIEQLIDQLASQARQTMRSQKTRQGDTVIEATPMWSLNYQGEVHIRVYNAAGKVVLDEYRK